MADSSGHGNETTWTNGIFCERGNEGLIPVADFSAHGNEGKGPVAVYSEHVMKIQLP